MKSSGSGAGELGIAERLLATPEPMRKVRKLEHMPLGVLADRANSAREDLGDGAARVAGALVGGK
jgi:hypothetical protein